MPVVESLRRVEEGFDMLSMIFSSIPRLWVSGFFVFLLASSVLSAEIPAVFRSSPSSTRKKGMVASLSSAWGSGQSSSVKAKTGEKKLVLLSQDKLDLLSEKQVNKAIFIARFQLGQMDKLYSPGISRSYFVARNNLIRRLDKLISIQEQFNKQRQVSFVIE